MTRFLVTAAAVGVGLVAGATARAGGPPPMYVVVDEVALESSVGAPERVTIRGSFIRLTDREGYTFGPPVEGVMSLGLDAGKAAECRSEWQEWARAAGTGKAVAVGMCGEAGSFLTTKIHPPGDRPATPDATYTPGHLGANRWAWATQPPVRALQAFVKARKDARAAAAPPARQ